MANDRLKHECDPPGSTLPLQWIKETDIPVKSNETDDITMPWTTTPLSLFPSEDVNGMPNPYANEMPLSGMNLMTDLNAFSDSEYPILDHLFGGSNTPIPPSPGRHKAEFCQIPDYSVRPDNVMSSMLDVNLLQEPYVGRNLVTAKGNSAAAFESIQPGEVIHSNTDRLQLFGNFRNARVNQPVLFQTNVDADNATNNNFIISGVQKDNPEIVDAGFLTLGIGQKTKDLDTFNILGRNVTNKFENVVLPQLNTFHGRKEDRSCMNPSPGLTAGLPCPQNNGCGLNVMKNNILKDSGNPSLGVEGNQYTTSACNSFQGYQPVFMKPVGSKLSGLPDSAQSRATGLPFCSSTATCLPVSGATNSVFSDSSMVSPLIGIPRSSSLHDQSGTPVTANEGIAAQVSEGGHVPGEFMFSQLPRNYYQPRLISADQSSTNISRSLMTGEVRNSELNRTPQGCSTSVGTSLKRVAAELSPAASQVQRKRRTQASVSLSAPILSSNVSPPTLSVASSFTAVASTAPSLHHQTKRLTSIPPLSQNASSLPPQAKITPLIPPLSWTTLSLPTLPGHAAFLPPLPQIVPSLPSQAKSTVALLPQPRTAPFLRPTAKNTTSLPAITQNPPPLLPLTHSAPLPSRSFAALPLPQKSRIASPLPQKSQTASLLRPKPQTASSLQRKPRSASSLQSAAKIVPPVIPKPQAAPALYIKWNGFIETQPMGHKCLICKRDLSFTAEGPVSVPTMYPMVAVLPCGHTFHDHCLQLITPDDQAKNPPCIPCAVGES